MLIPGFKTAARERSRKPAKNVNRFPNISLPSFVVTNSALMAVTTIMKPLFIEVFRKKCVCLISMYEEKYFTD